MSAKGANRIYVGNLNDDIKPPDLYSHFKQCGPVRTITKKYSQFAFVEFESDADAKNAIVSLNGSMLNGIKIVVNEIFNENDKKVTKNKKIIRDDEISNDDCKSSK